MKHKPITILRTLVLILAACFISLGIQTHRTHELDAPIHNSKLALTSITASDLNHDQKLLMSALVYYAISNISDGRWLEVSDFNRGWQIQKIDVDGNIHYLVWPDKNIQAESKHIEPNWFEIKGDTVSYHSFIIHSQGFDLTHTVAMSDIINAVNQPESIHRINSMLPNLVII